ncbi:hypothetical protein DFS34DRAFT_599892 [Phlyctochytrium arcticum]|nr:hypothetical protein DFS34DRAFT_599892 [Phlyctochytrium arcticum]
MKARLVKPSITKFELLFLLGVVSILFITFAGFRDRSWTSGSNKLTAVIIETSPSATLVPILVHFAAVLGPRWHVALYTSASTWTENPTSIPFQRLLESKQLSVRFLPPEVQFTDSAAVSRFLTAPWLWQELVESKRILMFQLDSIICANSNVTVDDFLKWDYIGAPIDGKFGVGYNGGLSIRNPKLLLDLINEKGSITDPRDFEDQWFFRQLSALGPEKGVKLPDAETAKKFAVETIYYERPLGYHQPSRWQAGNMNEIETWCPEVKMLVGRRATK